MFYALNHIKSILNLAKDCESTVKSRYTTITQVIIADSGVHGISAIVSLHHHLLLTIDIGRIGHHTACYVELFLRTLQFTLLIGSATTHYQHASAMEILGVSNLGRNNIGILLFATLNYEALDYAVKRTSVVNSTFHIIEEITAVERSIVVQREHNIAFGGIYCHLAAILQFWSSSL